MPTMGVLAAGSDGARQAVVRRVEEYALELFRRLPLVVRRLVTRTVAPAYTVGVVAVCRDVEDRVLLVRSRHQRGWGLPGGLLERGEQPAAAIVRELAEEVGVDLSPDDLPTSAAVAVDAGARQITIVYTVSLPDRAVPDGVEVVEVRWFARGQLPAAVVRGTEDSLRLAGYVTA